MPRLTVYLSSEVGAKVANFASSKGITRAEAIRRAFGLLFIMEEEKLKGNSLGIVRDSADHNLQAIGRILGV